MHVLQDGHQAQEAHAQGGWFKSCSWLLLRLLWELHACQAVLGWRVGFVVSTSAPRRPPHSGGTCARCMVQSLLVAALHAKQQCLTWEWRGKVWHVCSAAIRPPNAGGSFAPGVEQVLSMLHT